MKRIAAFFAVFLLACVGAPALAQDYAASYGGTRTVVTESWVEEWDPAIGQWVRVADTSTIQPEALPTVTTTIVNGRIVDETRSAARYAQPVSTRGNGAMLAQYGPFVVTSATRAAMVGPTDSASPAMFDAMLRDFPEIAVLEMIEAPGTSNDIANLAVGRRIRAEGIATHVPRGGSVRSGAVELFLAGATRTLEDGAKFAVHSWLDTYGREADDFADSDPAHRMYLDYYVEMGMSERQAREFYAMTNSVPHHSALWLTADDMRPWLRQDRVPAYRMATVSKPALVAASETSLEIPTVSWTQVDIETTVPIINYLDLSAVNLAKLDLSRPHLRLDSGVAFP